jgi:signal transduction histidine kinase
MHYSGAIGAKSPRADCCPRTPETRTRKANASKDRLFAIISHDLRSPAAALQHVAELIQYFSKKGDIQRVIET